jgi:hypothetical protein
MGGAAALPKKCVPVSVSFQVLTGDRLRQIIFGLTKGCNPDDSSFWTIHFELQERALVTAEFVSRVKLDVKVGEESHGQAEKTSAGLNPSQTNHLLGPGQEAADLRESGVINDEDLAAVVHDTLPLAK